MNIGLSLYGFSGGQEVVSYAQSGPRIAGLDQCPGNRPVACN
jgi:hypothetical protein